MLAHAGHGVNSYAIHYYLVKCPLYLFLQIPWGGAYEDSLRSTEEVNTTFGLAACLINALDQALESKRLRRKDRLLVVASGFYGSYIVAEGFADLPRRPAASDADRALSDLLQEATRLIDAAPRCARKGSG